MLKFFRRIRQKLIDERNLKKYMAYAIGEILLVVIGILIALQINTWNQNRVNNKLEQYYLESLKEDLEFQLEELNGFLKLQKRYINNSDQLIDTFENEQGFSGIKNLNSKILGLISVEGLEIFDKTFEELNSTGQIRLIRNEETRSKLIQYYQEYKDAQESIRNNMNNVYYPRTYPVISELTLYSTNDIIIGSDTITYKYPKRLLVQWKSKIAKPEIELRLINAINEYKLLAFTHQYIVNKLRKSTDDILDLIKAEID